MKSVINPKTTFFTLFQFIKSILDAYMTSLEEINKLFVLSFLAL